MSTATLVVQFHPLEDSFTGAVLEAVERGLISGPPVERGLISGPSGHSMSHEVVRLAQGGSIEAEQLDTCRHLIVVTPTWWGAMPAQILAWIQDELGPWIDGARGPKWAPSPLRTVERLTVVATHGSSRLINRLQGEPGLALWRRSVLPLCAPGARFDWLALYKIDRSTEADRSAFLDRVEREIRSSVG